MTVPTIPDHKNFAPRIGFAWDVDRQRQHGDTRWRWLVYETINWESMLAFNNAFGLNNVPTGAIIDGAGDTAGGTITAGNLAIPPGMPQWDSGVPLYGANVSTSTLNCFNNPCPIMSVDRNITTPYVWTWTLNMQHAFTPNLSLEVGYVGNHGTNLTGIRDINQPPGRAVTKQSALAALDGQMQPTLVDALLSKPANHMNGKFPYFSNIFQYGECLSTRTMTAFKPR